MVAPNDKRQHAKEIFLRAVEMESSGERSLFVGEACGDDVELLSSLSKYFDTEQRDYDKEHFPPDLHKIMNHRRS